MSAFPGIYDVGCPYCPAVFDEHCVTASGKPRPRREGHAPAPHPRRLRPVLQPVQHRRRVRPMGERPMSTWHTYPHRDLIDHDDGKEED